MLSVTINTFRCEIKTSLLLSFDSSAIASFIEDDFVVNTSVLLFLLLSIKTM